MKVAIVAATGRIGRHLLDGAVAAGLEVTAVVRRPEVLTQHVDVVQADLADPDPSALEKAVRDKDAVLSCLGPRRLRESGVASRGTTAILEAMNAVGTERIVVVSAAPVGTVASPLNPNPPKHDPGDGFVMRHVAAPITKAFLGKAYADLALMEDAVVGSWLGWTIVRPPRLTNGPSTGAYRTAYGMNVKGGFTISRAEVAHYSLRSLGDPSAIHRTVGIAY